MRSRQMTATVVPQREVSTPQQPAVRYALQAAAASLVVLILATLVLPFGYAAFDDREYVDAALRWTEEGPHAAANHWAARLPYVLTLAAGFRLLGAQETVLVILHSLLFGLILVVAWSLGRQAFGARTAFFSVLVALGTLMVARLPTRYGIEPMEMALTGLTCVLVLGAWDALLQRRMMVLFLAGIIGGLALSVRQTAIAAPVSLALLLLFADRTQAVPARLASVVALALGYALPTIGEMAFNQIVAGDPLHRLSVDLRHVEIPSAHLAGHTYHGGTGLFFNWDLAARWQVPAPIPTHWTLTPLVRLFLSPWTMLLPALGLLGAWFVLRNPRVQSSGAAMRLALLALMVLGLQYVLNTFVLVIAPNVRYYWLAVLLLCPLAAHALLRLLPRPGLAFVAWAAVFALPSLAVALVQPVPAAMVPLLERFAMREGDLFATDELHALARFRLAEDPNLAERVQHGTVPVGALVAATRSAPPENGFAARCPDGSAQWQVIESTTPSSLPWRVFEALRIAPLLPDSVARILRQDEQRVTLLRRRC